MSFAFTLSISNEGIAELVFDLPGEKVNKFSLTVLEELEQIIEALEKNSAIRVLTLQSRKKNFIAGADLKKFEAAFNQRDLAEQLIHTGHRVFTRLSQLPFPTIAVIHGACLGGGLECALSCTYRIVTDHPKTKLGLPEVSLGIFPGWGGTQRLPRLIGLSESLKMILTGSAIDAVKAWKIHLADAILPVEFLQEKLNEFIQKVLTSPKQIKQKQKKRWSLWILENNPLGRFLIFNQAKKSLQEKTKGRYPAPFAALEVVKESYALSLKRGLEIEVQKFIAAINKEFRLAPDLITLFFTQEDLKKEYPETKHQFQSTAVLGAGTMGAMIAWLLADHQIFVRLKDLNWDILGKGIGLAKSLFDKGFNLRKITKAQKERRIQLISGTVDYSGFQQAELVIEAATENLELKRQIFQEMEEFISADAVIASNTSSLTIEAMSQHLKHPERVIGMHFFNPVNKMPLVEIVPSKMTDHKIISNLVQLCFKLGKTPIVVGDCPGFLVNRIFLQGANEVLLLLEEGYSIEILKQVVLEFGMPMEPFELADEVGNDVLYKVAENLEKGYGPRIQPAALLKEMYEKKLYGKKCGQGFYLYEKGKIIANPVINELIKNLGRQRKEWPVEEILPRFLYGMINEASVVWRKRSLVAQTI